MRVYKVFFKFKIIVINNKTKGKLFQMKIMKRNFAKKVQGFY